MQLDDFDFILPSELIAMEPVSRRDSARLMTLERETGEIGETQVSSLPELLFAGDIIVLNDTKVLPARLFGQKASGGKVELFLVSRREGDGESWDALLRSSKPLVTGARILLPEGAVATVLPDGEGETRVISFSGIADFYDWLERHGDVPLPPYIRRPPVSDDRERYQTVFARESGAVAAPPTAGLHFTYDLLERIRLKGVEIVKVTLHVGPGTFLPVRVDDLRKHRMHKERFNIPEETAAAIKRCKERGGRVIAVGTTVVRTLEHAASLGEIAAGAGETDIFIFPGYGFNVVDAMITNFHLPKSTLLMLVSAFAGLGNLLGAYRQAAQRKFRFYSYGDAMFIYKGTARTV